MRSFLFLLIYISPIGLYANPLNWGHRLYFEGQPKKALAVYEDILHSTSSVEAALNAAVVAQELGRHHHAIQILKKAHAQTPNQADLTSQLAWALLNEGYFDDAGALFQARDAHQPSALDDLGAAQVLMEDKHLDEAENRLETVLIKRPRLTLAHYYLGRLNEKKGDLEKAVMRYEEVLHHDSHFIEPRFRLGALFETLDRPDDAFRQYVRINNSHVGNRKAAAGLARVRKKISKKPKDLLPPKRIETPTPIPMVLDPDNLPVLNIGIGTTSSGKPSKKKIISFRTSHRFQMISDQTGETLFEGAPLETWSIQLKKSGTAADLLNSSGTVVKTLRGTVLLRQPDAANSTFIINSLKFAPGMPWSGMADKELRGQLRIILDKWKKRLIVINHVNIEEYVLGVLAAEMPSHWPLEALKAQAVLARNLALFRKKTYRPHRRTGYNLCDEQHCQVYAGVRVENDKVRQAVKATRGQMVYYQGRIAHTVFSSNCGGQTQNGVQAGWVMWGIGKA